MKKIMFNDKYNLTQDVLEGRKKVTRRIFSIPKNEQHLVRSTDRLVSYERQVGTDIIVLEDSSGNKKLTFYPKFAVGEVLAIAQSYYSIIKSGVSDKYLPGRYKMVPGWNNKMFVLACAMPHRVQITGAHVERLQDITDEDCAQEGIMYDSEIESFYFLENGIQKGISRTARDSFAILIDKVSGKGTWRKNPFVYRYEFERINQNLENMAQYDNPQN